MSDTEQELQHAEIYETCLTCEGAGEIGVRQDYWGNWETEHCRDCNGDGEIRR